jgi:hypothetical protein
MSHKVRFLQPVRISNCAHIHIHEQKGPPKVGLRGPGGFAPGQQSEPRPPPDGADPVYVGCIIIPPGSHR